MAGGGAHHATTAQMPLSKKPSPNDREIGDDE